jgi:predicted MFS family arabinose efflux permease
MGELMENPDGPAATPVSQISQAKMESDAAVQEKTTVDPMSAPNTEFKPTTAFVLAFVSICVITLAAALDATSLSIALPIITKKLRGTAIEAFWSGTSFLLTSAVFQPVIAGLSHVFGRKASLMGSGLLFGVGSILAAVAQNFTLM